MRVLHRPDLLLLPLLLIGATCLSTPHQNGPSGPWVGEATNYGPDTRGYAYVEAPVVDQIGRDVAYVQTQTCPFSLLPGDTAAYEISIDPQSVRLSDFALPLSLKSPPILQAYSVPPDQDAYASKRQVGLVAEVLRSDASQRFALIQVTDTAPIAFQQLQVCGVFRTITGTPASVATGHVLQSVLRPGASVVVPLFFSSMPAGNVEPIVEGIPMTACCDTRVDLSRIAVSVQMTKLVDYPDGPYLDVVGELSNQTNEDLGGFTLSAHLGDSWRERIDAATAGCDGNFGAHDTLPFLLSIPVTSTRTNRSLTVDGLGAYAATPHTPVVSSIALGAVTKHAFGPDTRTVSARLTNDSGYWLSAPAACVGLHASDGNLVGAGYSSGVSNQYIAPGASIDLSMDIDQLAPSSTAKIVAYAQPMPGPPPDLIPPEP